MDKKWRANGEENKNGEQMDKVIRLKSDDSSKHDLGYHFYKNYIYADLRLILGQKFETRGFFVKRFAINKISVGIKNQLNSTPTL